jgi:hypothetical protein
VILEIVPEPLEHAGYDRSPFATVQRLDDELQELGELEGSPGILGTGPHNPLVSSETMVVSLLDRSSLPRVLKEAPIRSRTIERR